MTRAELAKLFAALKRGDASLDMQRRALALLKRWQPKPGRPRKDDPYVWRDRHDPIAERIIAGDAPMVVYRAAAKERGIEWRSVKREHTEDKKRQNELEELIYDTFSETTEAFVEGDKK